MDALAHEYWLEPETYRLETGQELKANLRNGENFKGSTFSYVSRNFKRFQINAKEGVVPVEGRQGDIPALSQGFEKPGLKVITYWSTKDSLVFRNWDTFKNYLQYEGLEPFIQTHLDRGLPKEKFKEVYTRNSKALVQVGPVGVGDKDKLTGMPFELLAHQNPYADNPSNKLKFTLYWQGSAFANSQVRIFEKPIVENGVAEAKTFTLRTDNEGSILLEAKRGHDYLLNSVRLVARDGDNEKLEPVWETWWAAMTFRFK